MSTIQIVIIVVLVAVGAAIALGRPSFAQTQAERLVSGGQEREYIIYKPSRSPRTGTRYPVVVMLHGGTGNPRQVARYTGIANSVAQERYIAVLPTSAGQNWNDGRRTTDSGVDDVQFMRDLLADLADRFDADPERAYLAGASNGGMMTQRVACEAPGLFRAYASVIANLPTDLASRCQPKQAVPILLINGTEDRIMPWNGGQVARSRVLGGAGGRITSVNDTFRFWTRAAGCSGQRTAAMPDRSNDGTRVTRITASGCQEGVRVELYRIDGGGHSWPGNQGRLGPLARRILGRTSQDINATQIILNFFRDYGL